MKRKIDLNSDFKQFLLWGFACLALLIVSTAMTYYDTGVLSLWALKKIVAWPALMGYFIIGYVISHFKQQDAFIKYLIVTYGIVGFLVILELIVISIPGYNISLNYPGLYVDAKCRICGFLENPNAYGVLGAVSLMLYLVYIKYHPKKILLKESALTIVYLMVLFFAFSRGAWISALGGLLILLYFKALPEKFFKELFLGVLLIFTIIKMI
jgi:hypothetical protein